MPKTETAVVPQQASALTEDEINDAAFRAQDLAWAVVLDKFTESGLTYKALGDRIKRSKSQVQRWLNSPFGMNIRSLGLLAEGLDVDLVIELKDRCEPDSRANYIHPSERAIMNFQNFTFSNAPYSSGYPPIFPMTGETRISNNSEGNSPAWGATGA